MVNNIDPTRNFILTLSKAGIYSPFEEEAYKTLQTLLSIFSY
jgi:hypothetical protein